MSPVTGCLGSLFFGSVTKIEFLLDPRRELPDILVLAPRA